jgi:hypothetical protein
MYEQEVIDDCLSTTMTHVTYKHLLIAVRIRGTRNPLPSCILRTYDFWYYE